MILIYSKKFIEDIGPNDPIPILEQSLSNFTTLQKDQIIPIKYRNNEYFIKIVELPPSYNAVRITGSTFSVFFKLV